MLSSFCSPFWLALLLLVKSAGPDALAAALSPQRPMRFIVPVAAGGSADVAARALSQQLTKAWGQPVIIDNRPGAGTVIGTSALASAASDGHTFGWVIAAHAINPSLYSKLPYDTIRDFAGV